MCSPGRAHDPTMYENTLASHVADMLARIVFETDDRIHNAWVKHDAGTRFEVRYYVPPNVAGDAVYFDLPAPFEVLLGPWADSVEEGAYAFDVAVVDAEPPKHRSLKEPGEAIYGVLIAE